MSLTLTVLLAFAAVSVTFMAVAMLVRDLRQPDEQMQRRLGLDSQQLKASEALLLPKPSGSRLDLAFYNLIENSGTRFSPQAALLLVGGAAVVGCAVPLLLLDSILGAAIGLLLLPPIPILWWAYRRRRRIKSMQRHLPETLELVADAVRAGHTLEQAADMVAEQAPSPLKEEFQYCARQLQLGQSPVAVLRRMARRIPIPEFRIFATAVLVHRQTGGNLALLAQRMATSARDRSELHGHVRAVTAASRLSVIGLSIGTLVAIGVLASIRPEYLEPFVQHELGPTLIAVAAALQIIGIIWVWKVLKVQF